MTVRVVMVPELEEFTRLARGTVRAWWALEVNGEASALLTLTAEAPSKDGGYVVYRARRLLTEEIIGNLERMLERMRGMRFDGENFMERVYVCSEFLFEEFALGLRRRGLEVRRGRYFIGIRPIVS